MSAHSAAPVISTSDLTRYLAGEYPGGDGALASRAREVMLREVGAQVHLRGLLEFSNVCRCDCYYCGIRRQRRGDGVEPLVRFTLTEEEILRAAGRCAAAGFGSMTLQSGERRDPQFLGMVERVLRRIKKETRSDALRDGLGITLCVGEQSRETYERFFDAGAHRYLLRIETSNPDLFRRLHPREQRFDERVRALRRLKEIGYQLGTGVMIGIPGQSVEDLAKDILFFQEVDADMIGMGPYLESLAAGDAGINPGEGRPGEGRTGEGRTGDAPLKPDRSTAERLTLALRMIASTRIALRDVNIAATTALQAISPTGREAGLAYGANVLMPIVTPGDRRRAYRLYQGKPCVDEDADACEICTPLRAAKIGRPVTTNEWGDAPHARKRRRISV